MMSLKPSLRLWPRFALAFVLLLAAGGTAGAFSLFSDKDKAKIETSQQAVTPVATSKTAPRHAKTVKDEPPGIALSVDSLTATRETGAATAEVKKQLEKMPRVTRKKASRKASSRVVVKAPKKAPVSSPALAEAKAQLEAKNYEEAVAAYNKALAQNGDNQEAWEGKVYALQRMGTSDSMEALRHVVAVRPTLAPGHAALARLLMSKGEYAQALVSMQRAYDLDPSGKNYALNLAILHDKLGQEDEALKIYSQIPAPYAPDVQRRIDYLVSLHSRGGPLFNAQQSDPSED
ncbi:MAG: tetratricopeptide repeat protein [Alphaproteobacteria bacterium]|nr:tetratricopeptide repeat protein [Alphaproteobacteria bacterium]